MTMSVDSHAGSSLLEVMIALTILTSTMLLSINLGLRQIQQNRQALLLNQIHMQVDALAILVMQYPAAQPSILHDWQSQFQQKFPQVFLKTTVSDTQIIIEFMLVPYDKLSKKIIARYDAG